MNLRQIEVFRAVMVAGSVTDAARLLHVSQPGISRMLAHIELKLGLRLFERRRGRLTPTPEAEALFAEVEEVYRGVQRIGQRARELESGGGLALKVLASPSTALEVVPRALAALAATRPTARLYLEAQLVREMVRQLVAHEADIAVSTLPVEHALLSSETVGAWSLGCVFPADHPFVRRRSVGPRDLRAERLIAFSADTPQGRLVDAWRRRDRAWPPAKIEVRSGQAACSLVACGAGVAVVDDLTARLWLGAGLAFRPLSQGPNFPAYAVHNAGIPLSGLARDFIEQVRAAFKAIRRVHESPTAAS